MNLWLAPQISEHCPKNNPTCSHWAVIMLTRPGHASTFTPRDGTAHECKTSAELMINRKLTALGMLKRLSTSSKRNAPSSIWVNGSMNLSNSNERFTTPRVNLLWPIPLVTSHFDREVCRIFHLMCVEDEYSWYHNCQKHCHWNHRSHQLKLNNLKQSNHQSCTDCQCYQYTCYKQNNHDDSSPSPIPHHYFQFTWGSNGVM